ncbi:MAG: hypothetical protein FWG85_03915 [Bacteroidetes bacterium]|nr:hypothetical protein [Bacteroidota bacterium]
MKKFFLLFISLLIFGFSNMYSQRLNLLAEKEIFDVDFSKAKQYKFQFANGKSIGSYLGIPMIDEIVNMLNEASMDPTQHTLIISLENNQEKKYYTFFDFLNIVSAISPYLITNEKVNFRKGDTIQYAMKGGKQTADVDFTGLTEHSNSLLVTNVKLQFNIMDAAIQKNIFSNISLIFPTDKSPTRWISDIKRIKIYKLE